MKLIYFSLFIVHTFYLFYVSSQYCSTNVGPTTALDSNVGSVRLVGDSKTISETTDCPGAIGVNWIVSQVADLQPGKSYTLTMTQTTCGGTYPTLAGAWIDFNCDYTFQSGEALSGFSAAKGTITIPFTVPTTGNTTVPFVAGNSRLRVQVQETYQTYIDPCANFGYGGTKDFNITLQASGSGSNKGGVSGGTVFLILLLLGVFFYILIGCLYNRFKKGTTGLKETCPQNEFWWNFCGYVRDGFLFTKSKCSRKGEDIAVYDSFDTNEL